MASDSKTGHDFSLANNGTVPGDNEVSQTKKISYGVISFGVFVVVIFVLFCMRKKMDKSRDRHASTASDEISDSSRVHELKEVKVKVKGNEGGASSLHRSFIGSNLQAMMKGYIIEEERLILDKIIGKGQFGCVYEGSLAKSARNSNNYCRLTHDKVAVKTLKGSGTGNVDLETIEAFLSEGMIMKDFTHQNVLTLLGVVLGEQGIPMIVLPYMKNDNLKKYVSNPNRVLVVRQLLELSRQVACGMRYLSEQKFVHRDLAARNCMLDSELTVKVADFGLSRDIYTKDYYCSEDKQAKLPVKWMALECLSQSKYTTKTDVWSFGVLLWELMTRGATPYPDVSNWDVWRYIKSGRRMRQPESCSENIYYIMLNCWRENAEERPTFNSLVMQLDAILAYNADEDENDSDPCYMNLYLNIEAPAADFDTVSLGRI